jgi:hypothetical protein
VRALEVVNGAWAILEILESEAAEVVVVANRERMLAPPAILRMTNTCNPVVHLVEVGGLLRVEEEEVALGNWAAT